ncbi:MAG: DUF2000 family protein [Actinocrinis sp.]
MTENEFNAAAANDDVKIGPVDTKIAVVVREDLATWQRLNVTAFAVSGIAATFPQTVGDPYQDAADVRYLPMFGQPVLVFAGSAAELRKAHRRALERGLVMSIYPEELFGTFNDQDNRAIVRKMPTEDMTFAGLAVYGPRKVVDAALKGLSLHK